MSEIEDVLEKFNRRQSASQILHQRLENKHITELDNDNSSLLKTASNNKKKERRRRPTILELKLLSKRPDLIDDSDTYSTDPYLMVWIKQWPNIVCIPVHWSMKSRYLSIRQGINKKQYELPQYIENTKISFICAALLEEQNSKTSKQQQREKVRPTANKLVLDFDVLYNAFFVHCTKPELTKFGELYYDRKEIDDKQKKYIPGVISENLMAALGMNSITTPPPWLPIMQKLGPPISYPNAKIPGVTAPIPLGAHWGVDGWGKPSANYQAYIAKLETVNNDINDHSEAKQYWGELITV